MSKDLEAFISAGEISNKILKEISRLVFEGQGHLDTAETIEKMIIDAGAAPAFPTNISVNSLAAHATPSLNDEKVFQNDDLVKIDFGVSVDGCVSDQATTVDLSGKHTKQVETAKKALTNAVNIMKEGVKVYDISKAIENTVISDGFRPISNLGGHLIKPGLLHAGVFIPNVADSKDASSNYELREGDVFAIEPFVTSGKTGRVVDSEIVEIFSLKQIKNVRLNSSRKLMTHILKEYSTLPFARRWIQKSFNSTVTVNASLRELARNDILFQYPVLRDQDTELVTQAEITVIVEKEGVKQLTPLDLI
ncbi:type II methionyl aminopeptidase [Candidatus Micrarchaeota archaeon]|nr:type II methionyl aminopeptidase [Candidatus Micrarchaeota archaeon]